jgi:uncharacterized protein (DUF697 family)/tellurite resistance protein
MTETEKEYIALAFVAAACADGHLDEQERQRIQHLADELGAFAGKDLFLTALSRPVTPEQLGAALTSPEAKRQAYQMASLVCQADGVLSEAEEAFLDRLRVALRLSDAAARGMRVEAAQYIDPGLLPVSSSPAAGSDTDSDRTILQYAILAGVAELLPQSAASLVILPLQLKLVYDIGRSHGVTTPQDQLKELVAAFGIGATSQVVESMARRVLGGVARQVGGGGILGGLFGGAAGAATGALVSFTTTYALGHAAVTYYEKGRTLSKADLGALFQRFQNDAKTIYPRVEAEIREQAGRMDAQALLKKVRELA